jgi:hypothetical protein
MSDIAAPASGYLYLSEKAVRFFKNANLRFGICLSRRNGRENAGGSSSDNRYSNWI